MIRRDIERPSKARVALLLLVIGLLCVLSVRAGFNTATLSLMVQVRPEARLDQHSVFLYVQIRLARGAEARLWWATTCSPPAPDALVIPRSGSYTIPFAALGSTTGQNICLASSDGTLRLAQPRQMVTVQPPLPLE
jgi:hypothetical protein